MEELNRSGVIHIINIQKMCDSFPKLHSTKEIMEMNGPQRTACLAKGYGNNQ